MSSKRQQKILEKQQREATQRKQNTNTYVNQVPFRYAERNFKSRIPPPDFSSVIDLHRNAPDDQVRQVDLSSHLASPLFKENQQTAYILADFPGVVIILNPFQNTGQRRLIRECLSEYTKAPNLSNLDTHYEIPSQGLWAAACEQQEAGGNSVMDYVVPRKKGEAWQEEAREYEKCDPPPAETVVLLSPEQLMRKMRWVMLGYQYHWPTTSYHFDRRYPMPTLVDQVATAVAVSIEGVGQEGVWKNTYKGQHYRAEAGVVNFYQYKDTLMGHVDKSELNMDAPLVSISLGNECIFLIGGPTRETEPAALCLHSGDIVVMTQACRHAFHGVPRILEDTLPVYLSPDYAEKEEDWEPYGRFMQTARININVRQVFPPSPLEGEK